MPDTVVPLSRRRLGIMRWRAGAAALALVFVSSLAACSPMPPGPIGQWGSSAHGEPYLELHEDGSISGSDGCNRLIGGWSSSDDVITFSRVGSTLMACPDVDTWLSQMDTAVIDGDELVVHEEAGAEIGRLKRQ